MQYLSYVPDLQAELEARVRLLEDPHYQSSADSFRPLGRGDYAALLCVGIVLPALLIALSLVGL